MEIALAASVGNDRGFVDFLVRGKSFPVYTPCPANKGNDIVHRVYVNYVLAEDVEDVRVLRVAWDAGEVRWITTPVSALVDAEVDDGSPRVTVTPGLPLWPVRQLKGRRGSATGTYFPEPG